MTNFRVEFSVSPWLLFLILPVLALIFTAFFLNGRKRTRWTANRIISAILQSVVAVLCVFALSGFHFAYDEANAQNELVILVDHSASAESSREDMDEFVREVLEANRERYETAIFLYGNEQKLALPMGNYPAEEAYERYLAACEEPIDGGATDLASALLAAWDPGMKQGAIRHPERAKVLILGDGLQTDRDALATVRGLVRDGVRVDTSFYAGAAAEDVSVVDLSFPENEISEGQPFEMTLTLYSSRLGGVGITLSDTAEGGEAETVTSSAILSRGMQMVALSHTFASEGIHRLSIRLDAEDDVPENDVFYSYYDVQKTHYMLILEKYAGESAQAVSAISEEAIAKHLAVETKQIADIQAATAEELTKYSEIVLYNIAAGDMTDAFQEELSDYAHEYGGGVFTVGGFEKQDGAILTRPKERDPDVEVPVGHSYQSEGESKFASMLPVTIEEYKPAVAVVYVFDRSGSMTIGASNAITTAVYDAQRSLELLTQRDFVGIVALEQSYQQVAPLLPMTKLDEIKSDMEAMRHDTNNGATNYAPALQQAVNMLANCPDEVAVKHIVLLSDGDPDDRIEDYGEVIKEAHASQGITMTVMVYYKTMRYFPPDPEPYYFNHDRDVKGEEINTANMRALASYGEGNLVLSARNTYNLTPQLSEDMKLKELDDIGTTPYHPHIGRHSSALGSITDLEISALTLGGYFPSRLKTGGDAEILLFAETSPLYAEWTYGEGIVGSIMIDLEGVWSKELLERDTGQTLIGNLISHLFRRVEELPDETELSLTVAEDNFRTRINIYGFDAEREKDRKLVAFVEPPSGAADAIKCDPESLTATRSSFLFENPMPGLYTIYVLKVSSRFDFASDKIGSVGDIPEDEIFSRAEIHRTFSYSEEYDATADPYTEGQALLAGLSTRAAENSAQAYEKFVYDAETVYADRGYSKIVIDPVKEILITALVLYLLGIVFRRFKLPRIARRASPRTSGE